MWISFRFNKLQKWISRFHKKRTNEKIWNDSFSIGILSIKGCCDNKTPAKYKKKWLPSPKLFCCVGLWELEVREKIMRLSFNPQAMTMTMQAHFFIEWMVWQNQTKKNVSLLRSSCLEENTTIYLSQVAGRFKYMYIHNVHFSVSIACTNHWWGWRWHENRTLIYKIIKHRIKSYKHASVRILLYSSFFLVTKTKFAKYFEMLVHRPHTITTSSRVYLLDLLVFCNSYVQNVLTGKSYEICTFNFQNMYAYLLLRVEIFITANANYSLPSCSPCRINFHEISNVALSLQIKKNMCTIFIVICGGDGAGTTLQICIVL